MAKFKFKFKKNNNKINRLCIFYTRGFLLPNSKTFPTVSIYYILTLVHCLEAE